MPKFYSLISVVFSISIIAVLAIFSALASAATIAKTIPFAVTGSLDNTTNFFSYEFNVSDAGTIRAAITWSGTAPNLTMSLVKNATGAIANQTVLASSGTDISYSAVADNVTSGATWDVKIIDYNPNTTASGSIALTWNALPPTVVTTYDATSVTSTSAVLQAAINPSSLPTTWQFVYVNNTENFEDSSGAGSFSIGPVNGSVNVSLAATRTVSLTSLQPGTVYYFRATAQNDAGSSSGNILAFTTLPTATTTTTTTATTAATTATTTETTEIATATETPTETVTTEATNETATTADFFSDAFNVLLAAVIGIVIIAAVVFMYMKGWHA